MARWLLCSGNNIIVVITYIIVIIVWIPFGDHPLKLERYRED